MSTPPSAPDAVDDLPSPKIVVRVLDDHSLFKRASAIFLRRKPDEDAASVLLDAYHAGRAPPWLAAHLLGCLRAPLAYETVRAILHEAPRLLAESYAGVAMARIAGQAARADLLGTMRGAQSRRSREGALYGLGELGDSTVIPHILAAVRDRLIGRGAAGSVVATLGVSSQELATWLRSPDQATREVALDAGSALMATESFSDARLALALGEVLAAGTVRVAPRMRSALERWAEAILRRARTNG
jgi:hypothetical protein